MITTAPELIYMLKVNIGIALFYAFYKLFCCRDTFFQWRRIALLSFLALSFLYPLMDMQAWVKEQPAINELADYYALMMLTETNTSTATVVTAPVAIPTPDLLDIIKFVYWIGILLLSARFMIQLSSIFRLVLKSKSINVDQISIRSLSEPANPFSFWQWIFIYLPGLKEDEKQEILTHEQTHVRQWHSIDVIISEIVNIICWMNPFAWLLKTEIRLNLEYLADHKVMESGTNKKAYQYHLLGLANQNRQTGLYNNFNLSHLKNRIKMMNKKRTRTTGHIKYALFAPLTAALLLVSNIETVARTAERLIYSTEESTPRPEREEVASFVNTTVQGLVTFTITVTNSEGKPQPNITLQIKPGNEVKTFKTNAEGKATIEVFRIRYPRLGHKLKFHRPFQPLRRQRITDRFTSVIHASTLPQGAIPANLIFHPAAFRGGLFTQAFWTIPHPHGRFPRVTGTIDSSSLNWTKVRALPRFAVPHEKRRLMTLQAA